ncbi:MAG TPA: zf-HC2 domain-containing protein [Jiangellaceae bacterium]|nr:zf-HC2 domain-containing protein [Jiangellaceae bacterium]
MTGGHLGAVVLAEYHEGLLPDRMAADVAEHLAHCSACSETHRQLTEVSRRLAGEPAALPIPAEVAARLDDALASEKPTLARRRTGQVSPVRAWRARMPAVMAAAATVAAVAFAGFVVGTNSGGDDSAGESQTTVAEGGTERSSGDAAQPVPDAGAPEFLPFDVQSSRTALTEQIREIVAIGTQEFASGGLSQDESGESATDPENARRCGAAVASDLGRALIGSAPTGIGAPGAVLVVTTSNTDDAVQGWVLPNCDATASDALATLTVPAE